MFLMSNSILFPQTFISFDRANTSPATLLFSSGCLHSSITPNTRRRLRRLIATSSKHPRKRTWWQKFFLDDDGNWLGLKEDDMVDDEDDLSEEDQFEAWKSRAEAISELREAHEDMRNQEARNWEDWLLVQQPSEEVNTSPNWPQDWSDGLSDDVPPADPDGDGFLQNITSLVLGREEDEFTYEDRVFRYASLNSAKFLTILVIIPWTMDFVVHDYVLMPFLDRYVKTVPLAAEFFDVRRNQKLEMINTLKVESSRFRFEVEIGKSPPLSDEEVWLELRHKALELRDEWRLENRRAFANIWSDMVFGITLFILLYANQSKVALLKFTGYKIINNISDTGKAFLIILTTDIFLGYHSESGWQTLIEIIVEHYGLEVDQAAITIFICLVPVIVDACVKLWLFKYLPRLSPNVTNIFRDMTRH